MVGFTSINRHDGVFVAFCTIIFNTYEENERAKLSLGEEIQVEEDGRRIMSLAAKSELAYKLL